MMETTALPQVGQKCQFDPYREVGGMSDSFMNPNKRIVMGQIIYVNYRHRWFLAEYGEHNKRISFKFCDIGRLVAVHGLKSPEKKPDNRKRPAGRIPPPDHSKPVICLTTGKIYPSATIAAKLNGCSRASVASCCRGEVKQRCGLEWAWFKG